MALRAALACRPGVAYALGGKFYLQPTGKVSGFAWPLMRGPAFAIDEETSGLARLPADGRKDPSPMEMCEAVERYYSEGVNIVGMGENDTGAAFAGYGEPLLRLQAVTEAATLIRERRHGVPLRVVTTGLGDVGDVSDVASQLAGAGISAATVNLLAATPDAFERRVRALSETYRELLGDDAKDALPVRAGAFGAVCTLVEALSEKGIEVEVAMVSGAPDSDVSTGKALAESLGAVSFRARSYHK